MKLRIAWAAAALAALFQLAWGRSLSLDEIEFFRATRWISLGRLPYRDFWELHTPLQWYLFAPLARFLEGPGTRPVLILRWAELPFWILASWSLWRIARKSGLAAQTTALALSLLWLSRLFADWAIEYRVDAVAAAAFIVALDAAMAKRSAIAGVLFAAATLANIRFVPIAATALLLILIVDLEERRWRLQLSRWTAPAAAAAAIALWLGALLATGSLRAFWQRVVVDNIVADRYVRANPYTARAVVSSMAGIVPDGFNLMLVDLAGIVIVIAGAAGVVMTLAEIRRPSVLTLLAFLQIVNLLFIGWMKVVYTYHMLLTLALAVPLAALAMQRVAEHARSVIVAAAVIARLFVTVFGANHPVLEWQDTVMKEADRRTMPGEPVLDGVGWVQTRPPAYEYWFLPLLAHVLAGEGYAKRYTVADAVARPPGVVIVDMRLRTWFRDYPALVAYFGSHYIPLYDTLWLPGLSGRFDARHTMARWIVPRSGAYRIVCSDPRRLTLRRNGVTLASTPVSLARGDHIEALASGDAEVFIVPAGVKAFFQHGPPLEAPLPARPHLPWR